MDPNSHILFHEYGTQLRLEPDGSLVLNVLCGRIGEFGIEFVLNDKELQAYKRDGDAFVKKLSQQVQRDPKKYAARGRTC